MLVKGILTAEDARLCVEHGVDGIIVSNHGGRSMDYGPSTLEVLPEIVAAVGGRIPVITDSGYRRGSDILKGAGARRERRPARADDAMGARGVWDAGRRAVAGHDAARARGRGGRCRPPHTGIDRSHGREAELHMNRIGGPYETLGSRRDRMHRNFHRGAGAQAGRGAPPPPPPPLEAGASQADVDKALIAAPSAQRDQATVIKWKPDGTYTTLRKGTNRLVCYDESGFPLKQPFTVQCTSLAQPRPRSAEPESRGGGRTGQVRSDASGDGKERHARASRSLDRCGTP